MIEINEVPDEWIVRTTTTNNFHLQRKGVDKPQAACNSRFVVLAGWSNGREFRDFFTCPACCKHRDVRSPY